MQVKSIAMTITMNFAKLKKIEYKDVKSVIFFLLAYIPSVFLRLSKKQIWLCVERIDVADDNAWMFFLWMRKNHPNQNVYFVLDSHNFRFEKKNQNFVAWGSFRHHVYYLASLNYIMATFNTPAPNARVCGYLNQYFHRNVRKIYLKHGIIKDCLNEHRYEIHHFRLFICGAKPEYDYVKSIGGYPEGFVQYTGLARFDDLVENRHDDGFILIIPTWRKYIGVDSSKSQNENEQIFLQSDFYKYYSALINGKEFVDYLKLHNLKARFCLHAEYRRFEKFFESSSADIDVVGLNESIHDLLKTTSMLITDYSSVFFDAAYVNKPVVYYHFDYDEFRKKHFSEGYFDYERDGMGPIAHNISELINLIESCRYNDSFMLSPEYSERVNRFFPIRDAHNCERIYDAIVDTIKND